MIHDLFKQQYAGHGKWLQCSNCGSTNWGGCIACRKRGYESKIEPICSIEREVNKSWFDNTDLKEVQSERHTSKQP